jgi:CHASE2 domain-containing sensor protein
VLYEMAARSRAFPGKTASDIVRSVLDDRPVLPAAIDPQFRGALQLVVDRGLEKDRELRYQHAADLAADLRRLSRDLTEGRLPALAAAPPPRRRNATLVRVGGDLVRAAAVAALAVFAYDFVEHSAAGKYLEDFQLAFAQDSLGYDPSDFEAGGRHLPLVVDLSALHPVKHRPTDREVLSSIVDALQQNGARAVGVDLSFDQIQPTDFQYFHRWNEQKNVRIGIFSRAVEPPDAWLGRPEFATLAAGIAMSDDNPQQAYAYTRRWSNAAPSDAERASPRDCAASPADLACKVDLYQLPIALWLIDERSRNAAEAGVPREAPESRIARAIAAQERSGQRALSERLELGTYEIDYSHLDELRQEIVTLRPPDGGSIGPVAQQLAAHRARIADRLVLVGDLEDTSDHLCYTPRLKPLPGVLVHACALATWNRGMLFQPRTTVSGAAVGGFVGLVLAVIVGLRVLHDRSALLRVVQHQHLEMVIFVALAAAVVLVARWLATTHGIVWPSFIWVAAALAVYPLSESFYRAAIAVPRLARVAFDGPMRRGGG